MAALTAATGRKTRNTKGKRTYEIAVETTEIVYQGGLVALNAAGRAIAAQAIATSSDLVLGIAEATVTGNTAGTARVKCISNIEALFDSAAAVTSGYLTENALVSDDQTITDSSVGTAGVRVKVGTIVENEATNEWWVAVGVIASTNAGE